MRINQEKRNGRTLQDKGDIKSALLLLSNLKELDTPTLMVVIKLLDHSEEIFDMEQPKEAMVCSIDINDYNLFKDLDKVYLENFKLRKKKKKKKGTSEEPIGLVQLEPPVPKDQAFDSKQLEQLHELFQSQNKDIEGLILAGVKTVLNGLIPPTEPKSKTEKKPKATAK